MIGRTLGSEKLHDEFVGSRITIVRFKGDDGSVHGGKVEFIVVFTVGGSVVSASTPCLLIELNIIRDDRKNRQRTRISCQGFSSVVSQGQCHDTENAVMQGFSGTY